MNARELAKLFHETYEQLAPQFGYETRPETRKFDDTSPNGRLMIAVCDEILRRLPPAMTNISAADIRAFLAANLPYYEWEDKDDFLYIATARDIGRVSLLLARHLMGTAPEFRAVDPSLSCPMAGAIGQ